MDAAFTTLGRKLQIIQKRHLLSHFQTSYSRHLIKSVFLISHPRQAPIQAAGTRRVPGQHSCKLTAVPESWQTEQSNWAAKDVVMPQEGSKHKQCAHSPALILCSWYRHETPAGIDCLFHINPWSFLILWATPRFFLEATLTSCKKKTICSHKLLESSPATDWLINFRSISNLLPVLQVCTHFIVVRSPTS